MEHKNQCPQPPQHPLEQHPPPSEQQRCDDILLRAHFSAPALNVDMSFSKRLPLHFGHTGFSSERTSTSKTSPHFLHLNSKIGI